jgi:hypothetical protein
MGALDEDVEYLNSEMLLLASDAGHGKRVLRLLGAHPNVIGRIASAGSKAVGTAIRCGVPLVTFTTKLDELLFAPLVEGHSSAVHEIPDSLRQLTRISLQVAHRVALIDRTVAQLHFGFTPRACDAMTNLSVSRLVRFCDRRGPLLRLRAPDNVQVWERLLIGDRCGGPRGIRISQQAALLSLGND